MRCAFGDTGVTLVLIADPKQAIYAFRGADVYAYLEAARSAGDARHPRRQLAQRPGADRRPRRAARRRQARPRGDRLPAGPGRPRPPDARACTARPCPAPLRFRVVMRDDPSLSLTPVGLRPQRQRARAHLPGPGRRCRRAAATSGAEVEQRSEAGETIGREPVGPGHLAVLVRTNRHAAMIRDALDDAGVPAVINGAGSVFGTEPARDWLRAARGARASRRPSARAHSAALTPFLGWTAERLAGAEDDSLGLGGGPPPPARLGAGAAPARRRRDARDDHPDRGAAGAGAGRAGRRAPADRPAPRRPAAARRGRRGADGRHGADRVAAQPDRRGRDRHRRRGAQPPARVRRRGRPGADDPPQQGPRVPDRLPAVPVGAGLHPQGGAAGVLPRPGGRRRAHDRRRPRGPRLRRPPPAERCASSAARTCGWPTSR